MRVLVVGAGAVGSWIGGALQSSGTAVTLVGRGPHATAMAATGLLMDGPSPVEVRPAVAPTIADALDGGPHDVALITVKAYDSRAVAEELQANAPARVVCFQNGVGSEELIAELIPGSTVIPGTFTTAVHLSEPGVVMAWHKGGVGIGAPEGEPGVTDIATSLLSAGLDVSVYEAWQAMKWSKLLLNLVGAASSAVLAWPPPQVLRDRRLFRVELSAWLEALAVMRRIGIRPVALPGYRVDLFATLGRLIPAQVLYHGVHRSVGRERGDRLPGVAMDLASGRRKTEISFLNGAVASAGHAVDVPTPTNAALCGLVEDIAVGRVVRSAFTDRPEKLLQALGERGVAV